MWVPTDDVTFQVIEDFGERPVRVTIGLIAIYIVAANNVRPGPLERALVNCC